MFGNANLGSATLQARWDDVQLVSGLAQTRGKLEQQGRSLGQDFGRAFNQGLNQVLGGGSTPINLPKPDPRTPRVVNEAAAAYRKLQAEIAQVDAQQRRGLVTTRQATVRFDALGKEALELSKRFGDNDLALRRFSRSAITATNATSRLNRQLNGGSFVSFNRGITGVNTRLNALLSILGIAGGGIAARQFIGFLQEAGLESVIASNQIKIFFDTLENRGQSANEGRLLLERLGAQFKVLPDDIAQAAAVLTRQGATLEETQFILERAGASALQATGDALQGFNNVATAAQTGLSQALNSIGVTGDLRVAYQDLAEQLGKTRDELTEQERVQALVTLLANETAEEYAALDTVLAGLVGTSAELNLAQTEARRRFGEAASEGVGVFQSAVADTLTVLSQPGGFIEQLGFVSGELLGSLGTNLQTSATDVSTWSQAFTTAGEIIAPVVDGIGRSVLGIRIGINALKVDLAGLRLVSSRLDDFGREFVSGRPATSDRTLELKAEFDELTAQNAELIRRFNSGESFFNFQTPLVTVENLDGRGGNNGPTFSITPLAPRVTPTNTGNLSGLSGAGGSSSSSASRRTLADAREEYEAALLFNQALSEESRITADLSASRKFLNDLRNFNGGATEAAQIDARIQALKAEKEAIDEAARAEQDRERQRERINDLFRDLGRQGTRINQDDSLSAIEQLERRNDLLLQYRERLEDAGASAAELANIDDRVIANSVEIQLNRNQNLDNLLSRSARNQLQDEFGDGTPPTTSREFIGRINDALLTVAEKEANALARRIEQIDLGDDTIPRSPLSLREIDDAIITGFEQRAAFQLRRLQDELGDDTIPSNPFSTPEALDAAFFTPQERRENQLARAAEQNALGDGTIPRSPLSLREIDDAIITGYETRQAIFLRNLQNEFGDDTPPTTPRSLIDPIDDAFLSVAEKSANALARRIEQIELGDDTTPRSPLSQTEIERALFGTQDDPFTRAVSGFGLGDAQALNPRDIATLIDFGIATGFTQGGTEEEIEQFKSGLSDAGDGLSSFINDIGTAGNAILSFAEGDVASGVGQAGSAIGGLVGLVDPVAGAAITVGSSLLSGIIGLQDRQGAQAERQRTQVPTLNLSVTIQETIQVDGNTNDAAFNALLDERIRSNLSTALQEVRYNEVVDKVLANG